MLSSLLPKIGSLGIYAYWLIFLFSFLEATPILCLFIPGLFAIIFGGVFVQQGLLDLGDVFGFAVFGNFLGAVIAYFGGRKITEHRRFALGPVLSQMAMKIRKYGVPSLIVGGFLGPLSGFFPFVVALLKMPRRTFLLWSFLASMISRGALIAFGYYFSNIVSKLAILSNAISYSTLALIFLLVVLWWVILSIKYFMPTLRGFSRELAKNITQRPRVLRWRETHPKTVQFMTARLHVHDFNGLPLTLFAILFIYFIALAVSSGIDVSHSSFILDLDERVSLLMHTYWNTAYIEFFTLITNMGNNKTALIFVSAVVSYLVLKGRYAFAAGLLAAVIGDVLTVDLIKEWVARPRPYGSYYVETSYSFPSAHAGISTALYGTFAYMLWRIRAFPLFWGLGLAASLMALIGFSRVYLLELYLSDVMNGWIIGAIWMCIGIVLGERWALKYPHKPKIEALRWLGGVSIALIAYGLFYVFSYGPPHRYTPPKENYQPIAIVTDIFTVQGLPTTSESIAGTPFEPINIIIQAKSDTELLSLFRESGWSLARPAGFRSLSRAALAAWTKSSDTIAPITPYFWHEKPNDFGFEMPTKENSLTKRHHIRVWDSGFILPTNDHIYFGAASFDDGLQWGVLHRINPNIDKEREFVAQSLARGGGRGLDDIRLTPPRQGINIAGDKWTTDGKAAVIQSVL